MVLVSKNDKYEVCLVIVANEIIFVNFPSIVDSQISDCEVASWESDLVYKV